MTKLKTFLYLIMLFPFVLSAGKSYQNRAIRLDGTDDYLCMGMDIIRDNWTIETWLKGENGWKETEVIIGGGEYSNLSYVDPLVLVIKNGRVASEKAGIQSTTVLDDKWHHISLSCDGETIRLYIDGEMEASRKFVTAIIPGVLGSHTDTINTFCGLLDEVRIWSAAIPAETLQEWKGQPLQASHPFIDKLTGYYTFDEEIEDAVINWVGKGHLAYHIRNIRDQRPKEKPLASTVPAENPHFTYPKQPQSLFNAVVIDSEWDVAPGTRNNQILKLRLAVTGEDKPFSLSSLQLDLSQMTNLADVEQVTLYYTGDKARSANRKELSKQKVSKHSKLTLSGNKLQLDPGIHYLLVTADIHPQATEGNRIKMTVPSFTLNGKNYTPETSPGMYDKQIVCNSNNQPDVVKVLQWNIWNSGRCLGKDGLNQIIRFIKETEADIITMQEGYGSQHTIAEAIGYKLFTPSPTDNLALFSRYPMTQLPSSKTFQSNPAIIHHPEGTDLLVNSCWLRYSYQPEYTGNYPEVNHDTSLWIAEDSIRPMKDIREILATDVDPFLKKGMPVIIGGDFNSCSHLDWTQRASHLHYGYGPVDFPTSRYMVQDGYKDSFREVHPNEVQRPDGTFAVIYGHLQYSRIDYIYYKGDNIRATHSKIIRTSPEIDDVWPSDHEAVITTFRK